MSKAKFSRRSTRAPAPSKTGLNLSHLRRETRTALELAVVTLAPWELLERLASSAGLLEALVELPSESPPALALAPGLEKRTREALDAWKTWHQEHLDAKMPRG